MALEALYGGAAGGGKSFALLMGALMFVDMSDYAALILRRTYKDLMKPKAILDLAIRWLRGTAAKYNGELYRFEFPSGAILDFGYCDAEADVEQYQGAEYQFIGFDELTHFSEYQYTYMLSRCRRAKNSQIPLRIRGATNPGGVGHNWVKERFIIEGLLNGRPFIPSKIDDNPHLDIENYKRTLNEMKPVERARLLHGDWDVAPDGNMFKREWFKKIRRDQVPIGCRWARYWDMAATEPKSPNDDPDWTVGTLMGEYMGNYYIPDVVCMRGTPQTVENKVYETALRDEDSYGHVDIYMEQEPGGSGVYMVDHYARFVLPGFSFTGVKTTGSKEIRAKPYSSAYENGLIYMVEAPWNSAWVDEHVMFPYGDHDDKVDSGSGCHAKLARNKHPPRAGGMHHK